MVHVEHEVGREHLTHEVTVHVLQGQRVHEALHHRQRQVVFWNVGAAALAVTEQQAHQAGHAGDEVQRVLLPVTGGLLHPEGMDAHTEPIHGVAVTWQGAEHRIDGGRNGPTGLKVVAEG